MGQNVFRDPPAQTRYRQDKTPFYTDVNQAWVNSVFVLLWFVQLVLLPSFKMTKKNILRQLYVALSIYVLWSIMFANFSYSWSHDSCHSHVLYKPYSSQEIDADVGVMIGLRGVNVTLLGLPEVQTLDNNQTEKINYNEGFYWSRPEGQNNMWDQGRFGFGIYSGSVNQQFRAGQFRGQPWPVQATAEWFTVDGERIRWARWYRVAGYYTHVILWTAVPMWFVTMLILGIKPFIGGIWLWLLGLMMIVSVGLYKNLSEKAQPQLAIPFEECVLMPTYGWIYYHTLIIGIILFIAGPSIMIAALKGWIAWDRRYVVTDDEDEFSFSSREETKRNITQYLTFKRNKADKSLAGGRRASKYIYARPPRRKTQKVTDPELVAIYETDNGATDDEGRMYLNVVKSKSTPEAEGGDLPNYQNMEFATDPNSRRRAPVIPGRGAPTDNSEA